MAFQKTTILDSFVAFANKFYGTMIQKQPDTENMFFSPLSLYTAVGMTMVGATGETKIEMRKALQIPDALSDEEAHKCISKELQEIFERNEDVEVYLANRIFLCIDGKLHRTFTQTCKEVYAAEVDSLVSLSSNADKAAHINGWVSEATRGKIDNILSPDSIDKDTLLFLINALFFKGNWETQFRTSSTRTEQFFRLDGQKQNVRLMFTDGEFPIADLPDLDARALRFPFKGCKWNLLIILPNKIDGLPEMLKKIQEPESLKAVMATPFRTKNVKFWLPKMKLGYGTLLEVVDILEQMGIHRLFTRKICELENMYTDRPLCVDRVLHKAIFEADEQGATAAAVTAVRMELQCATYPIIPPIEFRVDHPFLLALIHGNDLPAFIGHFTSPEFDAVQL